VKIVSGVEWSRDFSVLVFAAKERTVLWGYTHC
jgi:hypothetical protein